jgi:serine/threonine protein phosphatase 1
VASSITEASGERIFVIGDIHGCVNEPEILLRHLEDKEGVGESDAVIFLGDYIDRGPESKAVIDLMLDFKSRFPKTRFLKGNHEDMMLDFLGFGGNLGQAFLYNGGLETIQSYGISVFAPPTEMVNALPPDHFKFLCELESILQVDDFSCVHAGLNPLRDLTAQNDNDVFWIRDEFLNNIHPFKRTVVFGHTPHQELFVHLPYKVGIDTGLVFGNKLSCLELGSGKVFEIRKDSEEVVERFLDMSERSFD